MNTLSLSKPTLPRGVSGLERFHIALQAEARLADIEPKLADLQAELEPLRTSHQQQAEHLKRNQKAIDEAAENLLELTNITIELRIRLEEKERLVERANSVIKQANQQNATLKNANATLTTELKALRALNPQKLQKQVKRLQRDKLDLQAKLEGVQKEVKTLRTQLADAAHTNKKLLQENKGMFDAMAELQEAVNTSQAPKPISKHGNGRFELYSDGDCHKTIHIMDTKTGISRPYHHETGIPKTLPIPEAVQQRCQEVITNNIKVVADLDKYTQKETDK